MSEPKKPAPTRPSGEHPAVQFFRKKLDSINENEISKIRELNERLTKATTPAPKDPRREPAEDDEARTPRVDYVGYLPPNLALDIEPDPFPSDPPPPHEDDDHE